MTNTMEAPLLIEGSCEPKFEEVREQFIKNFTDRNEIGAAVCVYENGEKVVDLWGGYKDVGRQVPWKRDTTVIMNSIAKSMSALSLHMLIDRGLVDFDAPVAIYWPEFAQAGKEKVLVRHVLSHTCGVIYCDRAEPGDILDYDKFISVLEKQEPAWEPGTDGCYNSQNIGFLAGEIVHRVDGRTIGRFLREEVTDRLGSEYNIGLTAAEIERVSDMYQNPLNETAKIAADPTSPLNRAKAGSPKGYFQNAREIRENEVPSFGGHGNARGMARIYAALAGNGEIDGVRLLSEAAVDRMNTVAWEHFCVMTRRPMRMGYGVMHNETSTIPMGSNPAAFGHSGSGGAFTWADRQRNLSFAYCTNLQREGPGIGARGASLSVAAAGGPRPDWLHY